MEQPKLIARLEEIVKGIDRHQRVNASDMPMLAQFLKVEIARLKRINSAQTVERMRQISERLSDLSPKIDSGRFKYSEKQEKDRLVNEYLELEQQIEGVSK
jgi:hypothetical protein